MAGTIEAKFDVTGAIMAHECGALDEDATIELFQHLLDSGMVYHLQGSYQRTAQRLIDTGEIAPSQQAIHG